MARILTYDIENMAIRGWAWGMYEQNLLHIDHPQHLLCISYKWLDEKKVHNIAIWDYNLYKKDPHSDLELAKAFWEIANEADIMIGHNSKSFDDKMITAMFMRHKLPPPAPYQSVDTKQLAKSNGRFISNKLDDLGEEFGIGRKMKHQGFDLWIGCDEGNSKAQKKMVRYNNQDVKLTEKLYLELRPWAKNHPALNVLDSRPETCPKCGGNNIHAGMKYKATNTNLYQYYRCQDCGGMTKARIAEPKLHEERMHFV